MTKVNQGILQAQFNVKNSIDVHNAFDSEYTGSPLLKSVEGSGEIVLTDTDSFAGFAANTSLEHLDPVKSTSQNAVDITDSLNNNPNLKYAKLDGNFNSDVAGKFDGNYSLQKVDLTQSITVKPEDFKGNNSLKELPKLDYSNPDLTDIITNATTLKPTTIDISNQDNTTCLGVHGDSTHQLGQLDGVKVSYNAPFNKATGPQIDVSYTDLNSNGLVNLFNTMPYNVSYTKVGNPTIVDGIVSGFSYSNRLNITSNVANSDIAEMVWKFKLDSSGLKNNYNFIFYKTGNLQISIYGNTASQNFNPPSIYLPGPNQSYQFTNFQPSPDVWYWLKYTYDGTTVRLYSSTDGTNYTLRNTIENVTITGTDGVYQVGWGSSQDPTSTQYFSGSIDLNETYIKVNNKLWFGHESALVPWFGPNPDKNLTTDGTIVGSPTVVNGLATDFTTEDYIKTSSISEIPTSFKMSTAFTANELALVRLICSNGSSSNYVGFTLTSNGEIRFGLRSSSGTQQYVNSSITYVVGTKYYLKAVRNDTTLSISVSTDGTNWTTDSTTVESGAYSLTKSFYVGVYYSSSTSIANPFNGTIDLKNTSIVSGTTQVYSGMVPMTKTVKITGATGTANLTSDEKAIVTNKGWTLQEN